jgi:hypothetical protein
LALPQGQIGPIESLTLARIVIKEPLDVCLYDPLCALYRNDFRQAFQRLMRIVPQTEPVRVPSKLGFPGRLQNPTGSIFYDSIFKNWEFLMHDGHHSTWVYTPVTFAPRFLSRLHIKHIVLNMPARLNTTLVASDYPLVYVAFQTATLSVSPYCHVKSRAVVTILISRVTLFIIPVALA